MVRNSPGAVSLRIKISTKAYAQEVMPNEQLIPTIVQEPHVKQSAPEKLPLVESAYFVGIAILIGIAHYVYKVAIKELPFSWVRLLAELMLSGVAGYLTWTLCMSFGTSQANMGFFVGIAGWAGSKAMTFFETIAMRLVEKHLGVTTKTDEEKNI